MLSRRCEEVNDLYFDAVLNDDMEPVFDGTPEEVKAWLEANETEFSTQVCIGSTMKLVSVPEYLGLQV